MQRTLLAITTFAFLLALSFGCASKAAHEADLIFQHFSADSEENVEKKYEDGKTDSGAAIQIVSYSYLTKKPVLAYKQKVNEFFIGRGYTQAINLSTPNEFSLVYDGLNGKIRVEILAEVALPPASEMTQIPKDSLSAPTEVVDAAKREASEEPKSGDKGPIQGIGASSKDKELKAPEPPSDIHRITIKISY